MTPGVQECEVKQERESIFAVIQQRLTVDPVAMQLN